MHRLHLAARARTTAVALLAGLLLLAGPPAAALQAQATAPQVRITEYPLPIPDGAPGGLTIAPLAARALVAIFVSIAHQTSLRRRRSE